MLPLWRQRAEVRSTNPRRSLCVHDGPTVSVAHIILSRPHALGLDGALRTAEGVANQLQREYGVATRRDGDSIHIEGHGIRGRLDALPEEVRIEATLGFAARPFRRVLQREIERELDRLVSPT